MKKTNQFQNKFCKSCGEPLIYIDHYENSGSHEPYWECPSGCSYPELTDSELTAEELFERGKVDTCTEFGVIKINEFVSGRIF